MNILKTLTAARRTVPALKYAQAVVGIAAAAAAVSVLVGQDRVALLLVGVVFVGMILVFVFARLVASKSIAIQWAGVFLLWTVMLFSVAFLALTGSAFFYGYPPVWTRFLGIEVVGRGSPSNDIGQSKPDLVATSGVNSPAIVASGNVSVQYGIPPQLVENWLRKLGSSQSISTGIAPSIETLKSMYFSLQSAARELAARQPAASLILSSVNQGDLEAADSKVGELLASNSVQDDRSLRQLREIAAQIRTLTAIDSISEKSTPGIDQESTDQLICSVQGEVRSPTQGPRTNNACDPRAPSSAMGTKTGLLLRFPSGQCREVTWSVAKVAFIDHIIPCPG